MVYVSFKDNSDDTDDSPFASDISKFGLILTPSQSRHSHLLNVEARSFLREVNKSLSGVRYPLSILSDPWLTLSDPCFVFSGKSSGKKDDLFNKIRDYFEDSKDALVKVGIFWVQ